MHIRNPTNWGGKTRSAAPHLHLPEVFVSGHLRTQQLKACLASSSHSWFESCFSRCAALKFRFPSWLWSLITKQKLRGQHRKVFWRQIHQVIGGKKRNRWFYKEMPLFIILYHFRSHPLCFFENSPFLSEHSDEPWRFLLLARRPWAPSGSIMWHKSRHQKCGFMFWT